MSESMNFAFTDRLFEPRFARPVTIIGAGAVGSWCAEFFARKGASEITVIDDDVLHSGNVPMSAYGLPHIQGRKVVKLREYLAEMTGVEISIQEERFTGGKLSGTVVSCVDTMLEGRHLIWNAVRDNPRVDLYCDSRINQFYAEVFAIDPHDDEEQELYEATLFDDKEAPKQLCGMHTDVLTAAGAARTIVAKTTSWWQDGDKGDWRWAERSDTLDRIF